MIMNDFASTQVPYIHFQSMALTEHPVHVSPDGCVLVRYDSLLVCWLSSTSKSGTFYLLVLLNTVTPWKLSSTTLPSTHCHTIMTQCPPCCSPTASPSEFRAGGFAAEHVRGHGSPADWPAISAWSLWAPSQSIHAASCWAAHQTAGGGGLQKLSEHWFIFNVVSKVMFGSTTISLLASLGSTPSQSLCRLITRMWLKMDPSWQIAVKWSGTDYTVRSNICDIVLSWIWNAPSLE